MPLATKHHYRRQPVTSRIFACFELKQQELLSATVNELAKTKERADAERLKKAEEIALRVGKVVSRWSRFWPRRRSIPSSY